MAVSLTRRLRARTRMEGQAAPPVDPDWEDRRSHGHDCPACTGTGTIDVPDMPDGFSPSRCRMCGGSGRLPGKVG